MRWGRISHMNMEKFEGKKQEPMVPEEKQTEFAALAETGADQEAHAEELSKTASAQRQEVINRKAMAAGAAGLGGIAAVTGAFGAAIPFGIAAGGLAYSAKKMNEKAQASTAKAEVAWEASEKTYTGTRGIVEEGMKQGGAEEVEGQLRATPEQIEIARKEMVEKYGNKE